MKINVGKYRGRELAELPTEYLEWALGHLALSDEEAQGVLAEHARRRNQARVAAQAPVARVLDRAGHPANRLAARLHLWLLSWLRRT